MSFDLDDLLDEENDSDEEKKLEEKQEDKTEEEKQLEYQEKLDRMKKQFKNRNKIDTNRFVMQKSSSFSLLTKLNSPAEKKFVLHSPKSLDKTRKPKLSTRRMIKKIDEITQSNEPKKKTQKKTKRNIPLPDEIDVEGSSSENSDTDDSKDDDDKKKEDELKEHENMRMALISRGITPEYEPSFRSLKKKEKKIVLNYKDTRTFCMTPAPKNYGMVRCFVKRHRGKLGKINPYPKYFMYFEKDDTFLIGARKRKKSKTSAYLISLDKDDLTRDSGNFYGKLRGNFFGTEYHIFDHGESPEHMTESSLGNLRNMLGAIKYEKNILGAQGPRKFTVILPKIDSKGMYVGFPQKKEGETLIDLFSKSRWDNIIVLKNGKPSWNDDANSFVLNFNGRVTKSSIKNFQVVDPRKPKRILMQFGRKKDDIFILDYTFPFCAMQAFCIALSACDTKIASE